MALELDARQRAMLQEMGVRHWWPGTEFDPLGMQVNAQAHSSNVSQPTPGLQSSETNASVPAHREHRPSVPVTAPVAPRDVPPARVTAPVPAQVVKLDQGDANPLHIEAAQCSACGLCAGRTRTTLQAAPIAPCDWMVVGDAPDEDEDRAGHAFAQAPGVLLDNMLKAVGVARGGSGAGAAYVTNIVKCRPPHGQVPQAGDLAQCAGFLQREIALVQPKMILAMGRFAIQGLLAHTPALSTQPLGRLRGTVHQFAGIPVVVTYAPKVLLRASADKAKAWADLCLALDTLDAT